MAVRPLTALASIALLLAILGISARWIRNQALLYLGKISYGLYVIHALGLKISYAVVQPVRLSGFLLHLGLGLGITIILASLSYKYLEMPFLRLKESFTHIASRPA
jgi:peptidoglycan/LPS O-acetylase OafA/YrhL